MRHTVLVIMLIAFATPTYAQLGGLGGALKKAQQQKQKLDDLTISDQEERQIGEDVSQKIRTRFGVVQDAAVHKYVTLVGAMLAKQSERPDLDWTFIVLDTDGVNAFASPGGLVHITRGALALAKNEAELAGVLGHEIGHVVRKHTVNAIRKSKAVAMGTEAASSRSSFLEKYANKAYEMVLENSFDRGDELDADKVTVRLTQQSGYAAASFADFLARLNERNRGQAERNGLFASHPETEERIGKVKLMATGPAAAVVEARYKSNIKYELTPISDVAVGSDGSGSAPAAKEEPKKKGFGIGSLKQSVAPEKQSTQVSASGGARGLGADRAAKGGSNPTVVRTSVSAAELAAFGKGIV